MIELVNCYKSYDGEKTYVLNNLNLKIEQGMFVAITGESGSGKTTLLNILGTLDEPNSGNYVINNVNILKLNGKELADFRNNNIGFVFQEYLLIPYLSVKENILLPVLHKDKKEKKVFERKAQEIIETLNIKKISNQKSTKLSGGEKQRVSLARALINDPLLILADEPTGNLDNKTARMVLDHLLKINKKYGVTVILVTHDKDLLSYADIVLNLEKGKLAIKKHDEKD